MAHIVIDLEMNPVSKKHKAVRRYLSREVIEVGAAKFVVYSWSDQGEGYYV